MEGDAVSVREVVSVEENVSRGVAPNERVSKADGVVDGVCVLEGVGGVYRYCSWYAGKEPPKPETSAKNVRLVTRETTTRDCRPQPSFDPLIQRKEAPDGSLGQPAPTCSTVSAAVPVELEHVSMVSVPPRGKPAGRLIWYACFAVVESAKPAHAAAVVTMAASVRLIVSRATKPSRPVRMRRMGTVAAHAAAGVTDAVTAEGEPEAVKPVEGDEDTEGVLVAASEGDAPNDRVDEGDTVPDGDGVLLGVGRLEPVAEGVADGSW